MSLRLAVEEILIEIENAIEKQGPSDDYVMMHDAKMWSKMLRMALKASEGETTTQPSPPINPMAYMDDNTHHRVMIEKAKAEFAAKNLNKEEDHSEVMLRVLSGPAEGTSILVPTIMPIGAHTEINGVVYTRTKDGLHTSPW